MATPKKDTKSASQKSKTIVQLESPFTEVQWPTISKEDESTILKLLIPVLSPIGLHRRTHILPSKGKRSKRRRNPSSPPPPAAPPPPPAPHASRHSPQPPPPSISSHLTIGLNATTRHLNLLSSRTLPASLLPLQSSPFSLPHSAPPPPSRSLPSPSTRPSPPSPTSPAHPPPPHLALIFLPQPSPPTHLSITHAHLPLSSLTASAALPAPRTTRLVPLSPQAEPLLATALGIPRVGALGIMEGAEGATPLIEFVRERVEAVRVPWFEEATGGMYMEVRVGVEEVCAGDGGGAGGGKKKKEEVEKGKANGKGKDIKGGNRGVGGTEVGGTTAGDRMEREENARKKRRKWVDGKPVLG